MRFSHESPFNSVTWQLKGGARSLQHRLAPWGMLETLCGREVGDVARYWFHPPRGNQCQQCRMIHERAEEWRVSPDNPLREVASAK
jgi:hypothetical protein